MNPTSLKNFPRGSLLCLALGLAGWLATAAWVHRDSLYRMNLDVQSQGAEFRVNGRHALWLPFPAEKGVAVSLSVKTSADSVSPGIAGEQRWESPKIYDGRGRSLAPGILRPPFSLQAALIHGREASLRVLDNEGRELADVALMPGRNALSARLEQGRKYVRESDDRLSLEPLTLGSSCLRLLILAVALGSRAAILWGLAGLAAAATFYLKGKPAWNKALNPDLSPPSWSLAVLAVGLSLSISALIFFKTPHFNDEISLTFQSRLLARNHLTLPSPSQGEFFSYYNNLLDAQGWRSKYALFWPWVLSLGRRAGAPWAINPLLAGLCVLLTARLAKESGSRLVAWAAPALLATSPFFLVMAGTSMNHLFSLTCVLTASLGLWHFDSRPGLGKAVLFGAGLTGLALCRPFTGLCFLISAAVWVALDARLRAAIPRLALLILPVLAAAAAGLAANRLATGSWFSSSYSVYDPTDRLGFGAEIGGLPWGSPGHDPAKALRSLFLFTEDLSTRLWGWPFHLCLSFMGLNFVLRQGGDSLDRLLLLTCLGLAAGHLFYWPWELEYGPRYWFEGLGAAALLTARGMEVGLGWLRERHGAPGRAVLTALLAGLFFHNLFLHLPAQAFAMKGFCGVDGRLSRATALVRTAPSLVFVKIRDGQSFNEAFALEDPWSGRWVFARDLGPANAGLLRSYPGFKALYWDGLSLSPRQR